MQSMFEELYFGNVQFDGGCYGRESVFARAAKTQRDSFERLSDSLSGTEKEWFEQFCEAQSDVEEIVRYDTFTEALRFGVLFIAEVFYAVTVARGRKWLRK